MNIALNPEVTADKFRETYRKTHGQLEAVTLDTAFPQAARELAETSVAQTREAYERSKNALEAAVDTMARSFDALGQGAGPGRSSAEPQNHRDRPTECKLEL